MGFLLWVFVPVPAPFLECFGDREVAQETPGVSHHDPQCCSEEGAGLALQSPPEWGEGTWVSLTRCGGTWVSGMP